MASAGLKWALDCIAANRAAAGVSQDYFDVHAARASNPPLDLPVPDGLTEARIAIEGRDAIWVVPAQSDPSRRVVYFHGGGHCGGGYGSHRPLVAWLAEYARCPVLFSEFRLAPEHKFPAQADDAWAAYRHALAFAPDGSASAPARIGVAGDSAGGGLAVAMAMRARDEGVRMPDAVAVLCGMLDFDETTSAFLKMNQRTRDMARSVVAWLADLRHPWLSPVHADLAGLPPIFLQTGSADYCQEDSVLFEQRAKAAGVRVGLEVWPDCFHVWQRFAPRVAESVEALQAVARFLNEEGTGG
jgi:acetyl esterase/lipase